MTVEGLVSVVMLGACIWALAYLLPRARRQQDTFGVICALLAALAGLFGFLFFGIGTRS